MSRMATDRRGRIRRWLARTAVAGVLAATALVAPAFAPEPVRPAANAGITCANTWHVHWGTLHRVQQEYQRDPHTVVRYWWSFTWAGAGQTYLGAIACRI